jgi:hypothetical protein
VLNSAPLLVQHAHHLTSVAAGVIAAGTPGIDTTNFRNWGITQGLGAICVAMGLVIALGAGKGNVAKAMHQGVVVVIAGFVMAFGAVAFFFGQSLLTLFGLGA